MHGNAIFAARSLPSFNSLMKAPSITTVIGGKNKTLYMPVRSLVPLLHLRKRCVSLKTLDVVEKATRQNLKEKLTGSQQLLLYQCNYDGVTQICMY